MSAVLQICHEFTFSVVNINYLPNHILPFFEFVDLILKIIMSHFNETLTLFYNVLKPHQFSPLIFDNHQLELFQNLL